MLWGGVQWAMHNTWAEIKNLAGFHSVALDIFLDTSANPEIFSKY